MREHPEHTAQPGYRAHFDAVVEFANGGSLSAEGFRIDLPSATADAETVGRLFVKHLGLALVGAVHGMGLYMGVELVRDHATRTPAGDEAEGVMYEAMRRGLSFKVSAGNVLTLTPPLVITRGQLDEALDILDASIGVVASGAA